jgi:hypothetical protein
MRSLLSPNDDIVSGGGSDDDSITAGGSGSNKKTSALASTWVNQLERPRMKVGDSLLKDIKESEEEAAILLQEHSAMTRGSSDGSNGTNGATASDGDATSAEPITAAASATTSPARQPQQQQQQQPFRSALVKKLGVPSRASADDASARRVRFYDPIPGEFVLPGEFDVINSNNTNNDTDDKIGYYPASVGSHHEQQQKLQQQQHGSSSPPLLQGQRRLPSTFVFPAAGSPSGGAATDELVSSSSSSLGRRGWQPSHSALAATRVQRMRDNDALAAASTPENKLGYGGNGYDDIITFVASPPSAGTPHRSQSSGLGGVISPGSIELSPVTASSATAAVAPSSALLLNQSHPSMPAAYDVLPPLQPAMVRSVSATASRKSTPKASPENPAALLRFQQQVQQAQQLPSSLKSPRVMPLQLQRMQQMQQQKPKQLQLKRRSSK